MLKISGCDHGIFFLGHRNPTLALFEPACELLVEPKIHEFRFLNTAPETLDFKLSEMTSKEFNTALGSLYTA